MSTNVIYFNVKKLLLLKTGFHLTHIKPSSCDTDTLFIIIINHQSLDAFEKNNRYP
jgi:hypothetical protein